VVNLDIAPVEAPEMVYWVDPLHPHPETCDGAPAVQGPCAGEE
jgi:hypothetical protein